MPRDKKGRNANGRSSIFQSPTDGTWHGWVSVGAKDHGHGKVDHDAFMLVRVPAA